MSSVWVIPLAKVRIAIRYPGCWHRVEVHSHLISHPGVIAMAHRVVS